MQPHSQSTIFFLIDFRSTDVRGCLAQSAENTANGLKEGISTEESLWRTHSHEGRKISAPTEVEEKKHCRNWEILVFPFSLYPFKDYDQKENTARRLVVSLHRSLFTLEGSNVM